MSVEVLGLTKVYGTQHAVEDVSFSVGKGEILGFLGPNGAGKSTTMKIISCFIPPTGGSVSVCGYDVERDSMEVRRRIGYLPEQNPLYRDMYVKEYLHFVGRLHGVPRRKERVEEMIEVTGLTLEQSKQIGALSKGYRQRVGLAQAMLHDPEVLILDEPTSGLDPNQLAEIRSLIKQLGKEKTVIFSTHIMQEVQALCDRVVIINLGKIVADDPIEKLSARVGGHIYLTLEFAELVTEKDLKKLPHILEIQALGERKWKIVTEAAHDIRPDISRLASERRWTILEIHREMASVENIFQELTRSKPKGK
ncbi:MAG: gliding motility-associated ABC transporter ATP-binding subunit GldA [Saprospirales bacterium]|nr:gliding motility-associated ABC transporter ATP-binding subunit GldA [Saprospirales bacterium]MBK7335099.1 gliding motility-associated ABC transporter ATP-binding subunit GldA [Saprospirales bacterium]